jgi:2-polyprenyl-3-methyl-5-hydroxy-6-metoxy-1,4-benzoquinol methylase
LADWTRQYFDTIYLRRWRLGPPEEEVRRNAGFLAQQLRADAGQSLLDVACGQGRYSLAFAERGLDVVGLDASEPLLEEARRLSKASGLAVVWVRGDMRDLPYESRFDHAVLVDSLGFFEGEDENAGVLAQIAKVVRPGGRAAVVVVNGEWIMDNFETSAREDVNGTVITVVRELDRASRILKESVTVMEEEGPVTGERRQRLFSGEEVAAMARRAGLDVDVLCGDFSGTKYERSTSPKIILIGHRSGCNESL